MKYHVLLAGIFLLGIAASSLGATGMINAGEVLLHTGADASYSAAIDTTTGYAYFGTSGADPVGYLSMINLHGSTPTLVSSASENIASGVYGLLAVTIDTSNVDPAKHYLYIGTATGQILKMSPGTATTPPQVLTTLNPTSNGKVNSIHGLIDTSQGYAYFLNNGSTYIKVLRVKLSDFSDAGTVQIPVGETASAGQMNSMRYGGIDTTNQYLYLTSGVSVLGTHGMSNPDSPEICKINLQTAFASATGTFNPVNGTDYSVCDLSGTVAGTGIGRAGFNNPVIDEGIVIDAAHGFAYLASYNCTSSTTTLNLSTYPYNQSIVARIKLGTGATFPANPVDNVLTMQVGERDMTCGFLDAANGNIYFGTDNTYPAHVYMIHVGDGTQPMTEVCRLDLNIGTAVPYPPLGLVDGVTHGGSNATQYGEIYLRSGVIDPANNRLYYGTDSTPGQVIQVNINQLPSVTVNPVNQTGTSGATVQFTAAAMATLTPTVQWQVSTTGTAGTFSNITGNATATTGTLTLTNVAPSQNGSAYQAVFTNAAGSSTTTAATLTVYSSPALTLPSNITVPATSKNGAVVTFSGTANDTADGMLTPLYSAPPGSTFPIGTTTVTGSATDSGGLTSSGTFTITVQRTFAWFQSQYGLSNPDPVADPNHTGVCQLSGYAFGVNPSAPDRSQLPKMGLQNGYLQISYPKWIDAGDLTYVVEVSGDLQTWSSGPSYTQLISVTPIDGTREQVIEGDLIPTTSTPHRFIRVKVMH